MKVIVGRLGVANDPDCLGLGFAVSTIDLLFFFGPLALTIRFDPPEPSHFDQLTEAGLFS